MADTRTISDEETTLDQLTAKEEINKTDLLLTRDVNNNDYKITAQDLAEFAASGSLSAGEKKAVNGETIKTALDGKQAAGNYATQSDLTPYAKTADVAAGYQPKGNYQPAGNYETTEHAAQTYQPIGEYFSSANFVLDGDTLTIIL